MKQYWLEFSMKSWIMKAISRKPECTINIIIKAIKYLKATVLENQG